MQAIIKPTRISIYVNTGKKTIAQVKAETGCDYIVNGGVFNWSWTPACWLKKDGKLLASESWKAYGYGWDTSDMTMMLDPEKKNFINCVALCGRDFTDKDVLYPSDMGGARARTAIGTFEDGRVIVYCDTARRTPEGLRDYLRGEFGVKDALMLDGGGSAQCIFPNGKVTSSRIVYDFICFWTKEDYVLKKGSTGAEVKALQTKLNKLGRKLTVDGDFGANTENTVKWLQNYTSLSADGIAGDLTLAMLDRVCGYLDGERLACAAIKHLGASEPSGDDDIIKAYNKLAGTSFGYSVSWCQMFAVVCQKEAGITPYITASCTAARNYYRNAGLWVSSPQAGDLVYFDWDRSGDCDHVGVVAEVSGSTIYVIEGNASGSGYDAVRCKSYAVSNKTIAGYARVSGGASVPAETAYTWAKSKGYIVDELEAAPVHIGGLCEILKRYAG